jgi:hypothetical protein
LNKYLKAQSWCLNNNIKIYMVAIKGKKSVYIDINIKGKIIRSPKIYAYQNAHKDFPKEDASSKIWDLYLYLYNKKSKHGRKN